MLAIGLLDIPELNHEAVVDAARKTGLRGYGFATGEGTRLIIESVIERYGGQHDAADALAGIFGTRFALRSVGGIFPRLPPLQAIKIVVPTKYAAGFIDRVDANGNIFGWAAPALGDSVRAAFSIDGASAGQTSADIFREDLLKAGIGLGTHGFKYRPPDHFLDGRLHAVEVDVLETGDRFERKLVLPFHFNCRRPWLGWDGSPGWSSEDERELQEAKHFVMDGGALDRARELVERRPIAILRDLGFVERYARKAATLPTFKLRLDERFARLYGSQRCDRSECCKELPLRHDPARARWLIDECPQLMRHFASKLVVKEYGARFSALLFPAVLALINDVSEFDHVEFPEKYVLKPEVDSGHGLFLMHGDLNLFDGIRYSREQLRSQVAEYLGQHTAARFVVEEFLVQESTNPSELLLPLDYKLHAFGGKVRIIHVDDRNTVSRDPLHRQQSWLSRDWGLTPFRMRIAEQDNNPIRRPNCFESMLEMADKIAADLKDYIRIDMYATDRGPMLGELTTSSHAGLGFTDYGDVILSQAWELFEGVN